MKPFEINRELSRIKDVCNGKISFGTLNGEARNVDGEMHSVSFPVANADVVITHNLMSVPIGYLLLKNSASSIVYDGVGRWTNAQIALQASVITHALIFILR